MARHRKLTNRQIEKAVLLKAEGLSYSKIGAKFGVSTTTIHNRLKELDGPTPGPEANGDAFAALIERYKTPKAFVTEFEKAMERFK